MTADGTTGGSQLGGPRDMQVRGDFGGGTLSVELSFDGIAFGEGYSLTAPDVIKLDIDAEFVVRFVLTGSTSPNIDIIQADD